MSVRVLAGVAEEAEEVLWARAGAEEQAVRLRAEEGGASRRAGGGEQLARRRSSAGGRAGVRKGQLVAEQVAVQQQLVAFWRRVTRGDDCEEDSCNQASLYCGLA